MAKQKQKISAEQFSPEEQAQLQHYGQALVGQPTDFDDEVERELAKHYPHEASYEKMRAAQTGGSLELGPTEAEQRQVQQQAALGQQAATAGQVAATQAQAAQASQQPPAAPQSARGASVAPAQSPRAAPIEASEASPAEGEEAPPEA
jgi:hypothetical protein